MDLFALSKLVVFGGEISRRLISFSKKIDEAPSSIRSMGFEIRSTCDVLNELHAVLKRQQNERMSSISSDALEELQEAFDRCDEIIYEVGQGVLIAHARIDLVPIIDDMLVLSIQERVIWPLLRPRLYSLVADLSDAKMDIVLHLLVLQVRSERFYGRRMDVALFTSLSRDQREETIAQLWHNKMQRDPEPEGAVLGSPIYGAGSISSGEGGSPVLQRLTEESSEEEASDAETSSNYSERRGRSFFRRIVRRLSGDRKASSSTANSRTRAETVSRPQVAPRSYSERPQMGRARSTSAKSTSELSSNSSTARSWNSNSSGATSHPQSMKYRPPVFTRPSLLSITNPIIPMNDGAQQRPKGVSWKHGPTMSAKRGIELEWDNLKMQGDWDEGTGEDERRLGHQLLLSQLSSKGAIPRREALSTPAIVDMLVMRWTTSPRHRRDSFVGSSQSSMTIAGPSSHATFYSAGGEEDPAERYQYLPRGTPVIRRELTV